MVAIGQAINGGPHSDGVITLCDDVNSVFLHPNILSCTITLNADLIVEINSTRSS